MRALALCVLIGGAAAATAADGKPAVIPFRWTPGQIEVEVSVNGTAPVWFLVDTGAEFSVIDTELARSLHLTTFHQRGRDFADRVSLRLGAIELRDQQVMIMPFDHFRRRGRTIAGLVGHDFFANAVVRIDYVRRTLTVHPPAAFRASAGARAVPLTFAGRLATVPVVLKIAGGAPIRARVSVDTAASQALVLRHPFAERHGLVALARDRSVTANSLASGPRRFLQLSLAGLELATWQFDDVRIDIYGEPSGAGGSTATDGLIGNEILRRFTVTIDYRRGRLYLEPNGHLRDALPR